MSATLPLGFGACGFGAAAFGWGTPASASSDLAAPLLQPDGTQGNAVALDPTTGDYVLDARGRKAGGDPIAQKVYMALRTKLGSAAVATMGIDMPQGTITDDLTNRIQNAVASALKPMMDAGQIAIVGVSVTRVGVSAVRTQVQWRETGGNVQSTFV